MFDKLISDIKGSFQFWRSYWVELTYATILLYVCFILVLPSGVALGLYWLYWDHLEARDGAYGQTTLPFTMRILKSWAQTHRVRSMLILGLIIAGSVFISLIVGDVFALPFLCFIAPIFLFVAILVQRYDLPFHLMWPLVKQTFPRLILPFYLLGLAGGFGGFLLGGIGVLFSWPIVFWIYRRYMERFDSELRVAIQQAYNIQRGVV